MDVYPLFLSLSALVGGFCAGFLLAQGPRRASTRLAATLVGGAAWWALCEAHWNAAPDAGAALYWMRLSTPGWAFIGGLLPHGVARYLDAYPPSEFGAKRARLLRVAAMGYAAGVFELACAWLPGAIQKEVVRVPWGFSYVPGWALLAFLGMIGTPLTFGVVGVLRLLRGSFSVAPPVHRLFMRLAVLVPLVLVLVTDVALPVARIPFPRLGSTAYTLLGIVALVSTLRYGITFLAPADFSQEILETLHEGVVLVTPQGRIRRVNRSFTRLTERSSEDLVGCELAPMLEWDAPPVARSVENEAGQLHAEDQRIPVRISAAPLRDRRDNTIGVVVVVRDQRELEDLRGRMLTQARLAAVGELAAGIAHEMNNPLAFVHSNLSQLEREWKRLSAPDELSPEERAEVGREGCELIAETLIGVNRAAEIVRGVRRFTHTGPPERVPSDLNGLVEDAIAMLRPYLSSEVVIAFEPGAVPEVNCAPQELRQVFLNLLVNAVDAVKPRGRIEVATRRLDKGVEVRVADDGCGMEPNVLERIFDPFFTTKTVGEGTGLGLAITWTVVEAHGGTLAVESRSGHGTTFRVCLPAGEAASRLGAAASQPRTAS